MTGLRGEAAIIGIAELPAEHKQTRPPSFTLDQYALLAKMVVEDAGVDATVVNGLIEKHGGIQGIVAQLEQQGLGGTVRSWVGSGANQPITADQIHQAFGSETVKQLAARIGISPEDLAAKLSAVLPQAIDKLTPGGVVAKT